MRRASARTSRPLKIRLIAQLKSDVEMLTSATNATADLPFDGKRASHAINLAAGGDTAST